MQKSPFSPNMHCSSWPIATLFVCITLTFFESCAPRKGPTSINEYGLEVVKWHRVYRWQVDSMGRASAMVPLTNYLSPLRTDVRYATTTNFTGEVLYKRPALFLRREAAEAIKLVSDSLKKKQLSLLIYDAYRPYSITQKMWEIVPDDRYAANPANGSGHNRGVAVDLTLCNLATGEPLAMPTPYDNFTDTAHHSFTNLPAIVAANRAQLKGVMEHYGFKALETEWWHYALPDPKRYPLLDLSFKQLKKLSRRHVP
jgi:D-alanyl-D-alanine dipeptidase